MAARRTRALVEELSRTVRDQQDAIERLSTQVGQLRREARAHEPVARDAAAGAVAPPAPSRRPAQPVPPTPTTPAPTQPPLSAPVPVAPRENPWPDLAQQQPSPAPPPPPVPKVAPRENPWPELARERELARPREAAAPTPPARPAAPPPPSPPPPPPPRRPSAASAQPPASFDFESLLGVKLFSAIAGIALVLAAIFFLKYSVEHGWLQPPIRVLIGTAVGVSLLVVCEMKAARRYPVTANALDAAAIAVLFSTFFAAHALWNLIPSIAAFVLLALVTAVAVLLSIRRESLFIAVLGLLGGFATPALLSTGENKPIPLFAYLLLLNIGLAWVAYRRRWTILSVLTLAFTTLYQWGWAAKFLSAADIPLALAIFILFPVVGFG